MKLVKSVAATAVLAAFGLSAPAGAATLDDVKAKGFIQAGVGFMLIALPNLDGSFTVTLFMPNDGRPGFAQLDAPEKVRAFFDAEFPDASALIPDLETAFFENPTGELGTELRDEFGRRFCVRSRDQRAEILDERFEFGVTLTDMAGHPISVPAERVIRHADAPFL